MPIVAQQKKRATAFCPSFSVRQHLRTISYSENIFKSLLLTLNKTVTTVAKLALQGGRHESINSTTGPGQSFARPVL